MKTIRLFVSIVVGLVLTSSGHLSAKDSAVRVVTVSRVDAAKGRVREKAATAWMTLGAMQKLTSDDKGKQILYFEYHGALDKWRAIYTDKAQFRGFSWWTIGGEHEMEAKVNEQMNEGLQPAFIARSGNWYSMMFVQPDQFVEARKLLDEIGVGEPKLKK